MTMPTPVATRVPDNKYLRGVVELLPGYQTAVELEKSAAEALRTLPAPAPVPAELDPRVTGRILDEWHDAIDDYEAATARYEKRRQRILNLQRHAVTNARSVIVSHTDVILGVLHGQLTSLLDGVAAVVDSLAGAETPDAAIELGVAEAWQQLQREHWPEYAELRAAQEWLMLKVAPEKYWRSCRSQVLGSEDHASLFYLRRIGDVWPDWKNRGLRAQPITLDPSAQQRAEPWPADKGAALLVWLINSDAEPWIPTLRQLDAAFTESPLEQGHRTVEPSEVAARRAEFNQLIGANA